MRRGQSLCTCTPPTGGRVSLLLVTLAVAVGSAGAARAEVKFKKNVLDDKFRSEGCAVGDFNHDGKLDVSAGTVYYAAPDWRIVAMVEKPVTYEPKAYSNSFCNFADDINGDGRTDLIVQDHPGMATWWLEQPEKEGRPWTRHDIMPVANNESPGMYDIDGDGEKEWLMGYDPGGYIGYAKRKADRNVPWASIPSRRPAHLKPVIPTQRINTRTASASATSTTTAASTSWCPRAGGSSRQAENRRLGHSTRLRSASPVPRCALPISTATAMPTS